MYWGHQAWNNNRANNTGIECFNSGDHRQTTVSNGVEVDTKVAVSDFFGDSLDVLNTLTSLSKELQDPSVDPADPQVQSDIENAIKLIQSKEIPECFYHFSFFFPLRFYNYLFFH